MKSCFYLPLLLLVFILSCDKKEPLPPVELFEPGIGVTAKKSGHEWSATPFLREYSNPNNAWYCEDFYSLNINTYSSSNRWRENMYFYTFPLEIGKYRVVNKLDSSLISCDKNSFNIEGRYFRLDEDVLLAAYEVSDREESYFWIDEVKDSVVSGRFELYLDNNDSFAPEYLNLPDQLNFTDGEFEAKIQ